MERPGTRCLPPEVARLMQRAESAITVLETAGAGERRSLAISLPVQRHIPQQPPDFIDPNPLPVQTGERSDFAGPVGPRLTATSGA